MPQNNGRGHRFLPWEICSHLGMNHCILEWETLFSQAVNYTSTVSLTQSTWTQPLATAANKSFMELLPILFIQQKVATCWTYVCPWSAKRRSCRTYVSFFLRFTFKRVSPLCCWKTIAEHKKARKQHESCSASEQFENRNAMAITLTMKTTAIKSLWWTQINYYHFLHRVTVLKTNEKSLGL